MSNSAGLADAAKHSRIKRKAVRPPVAGRPFLAAQESSPDLALKTNEQSAQEKEVATIEPSEVKISVTPLKEVPQSQDSSERQQVAEKPKGKTKKKKTVVKKIGHTQPRFEVRLSGDHEKLVEDIQRKAFREAHVANKGINNSELFGGFLEAVRPFRKDLSFSRLDFKRGKLYGDGTERIKVEVGKSIQQSTFEYFLSAVESGEDEIVGKVLSSLSKERREKIAAQILTDLSYAEEEERLAANS